MAERDYYMVPESRAESLSNYKKKQEYLDRLVPVLKKYEDFCQTRCLTEFWQGLAETASLKKRVFLEPGDYYEMGRRSGRVSLKFP